MNNRVNFYCVGRKSGGTGVLVPLQTDVPRNVDCTWPLYFFGSSCDALRFYNAVYCRAAATTSLDDNRAQQRQKRARLKRETRLKQQRAVATPTVCVHARRDQCTCYDTWKKDVLGDQVRSVKWFKRRRRHQGELHYAAFTWQPPEASTVVTYLLTYKVSWDKLRPHDKTVVLRHQEKTMEQL
jgi:hypothetical protein